MKNVLIILLVFLSSTLAAQEFSSEKHNFTLEKISPSINKPWGMDFLPDGSLLVTQRIGNLYLLSNNKLQPIEGIPQVYSGGQGGLLDVKVHPDFEVNQWVYFTYSHFSEGKSGTALARGKLQGSRLKQVEDLFVMSPLTQGRRHFGSRIVFAANNQLFMTIGDRGIMQNGQDINTHAGSVLRFTWEGKAHPENPYYNKNNGLKEIYSIGHRNAQGMVWDNVRQLLFATEHGPKGGDELNIIEKGKNYGWPRVTSGIGYDNRPIGTGNQAPGMENARHEWTPSMAPSGLTVYYKDHFPKWKGSLFAGALKFQQLYRLEMNEGEITHQEILLSRQIGRIRDVQTGPDGFIYLLTDETNGGVYRLK